MKYNILLIIALLFVSNTILAQSTHNITGTVTADSEPLPGATITIKDSQQGTVSDFDGNFSLQVPNNSIIVVNFIGYIAKEVQVTQSKHFNISLQEDAVKMDEVVIIGYGSVKKSDLTGSVASIKSEDLNATSISSIDQGIQGKAAGVVVTQNSGQPGSGTSIRIRGTTSIMGSNEPLYVIDGMPITNEGLSTGAVKGPNLNPLASINPNDIESIEVLKDASATAIYGARGAAGVILVTTKRGKKGDAKITFDYYRGIQQINTKINMLTAEELAILGNEAADNANVDRNPIYASPTNLGVGTDWQNEIFRSAPISNYQLSATGGSEKSSYLISANYFDQDGIILGSDYSKGNFRINYDNQIKERLKVGVGVNLNRSVLNGTVTDDEGGTASSVTSWALEFNPGLGVYDENGDYTFENNCAQPAVGNPVADALEVQQKSTTNRILSNLYAQYKIASDLYFKSSFGIDAQFIKEQSFYPNFLKRAEASGGQAASGNVEGLNWLTENTLSYNKKFNGIHSLDAVIGFTMQSNKTDMLYAASSEFDDNRLGYNDISKGNKKTLMLTYAEGFQMISYLARINYNYNEKYLLTLSGRVDGSSKFGDGNEYGFFPSFAAAWRVSEEDFMQNISQISTLKIRAGYGIVGNEGIKPYGSLGLLETTEAYFGENEIAKGSGPYSPENQKLKWETTKQFNAGFDLGLFSSRIMIVSDFYQKNTTDLLLDAPVPYISGYKSVTSNIGNMTNKGFEFSINTVNTVNIIEWSTSFNIAYNKNEVTKLTGEFGAGVPGAPLTGVTLWTEVREGTAINTIYGYESDGIIQLDEDPSTLPYFSNYAPKHGDRKYVDQNGDGIINEDDMIELGNAHPDFTFALTNTFSYKNISLSIYLQGVQGNSVANFNRFALESFDGKRNNSTAALERWTPDNPTNEYPRANATPMANVLSDVQVEDASYIRVKDITLSYNFPKKLISKIKLENLRAYINLKNLYTFTNYSGYNPEVNRFTYDALSLGADYGSYPSVKTISLGLSVTF